MEAGKDWVNFAGWKPPPVNIPRVSVRYVNGANPFLIKLTKTSGFGASGDGKSRGPMLHHRRSFFPGLSALHPAALHLTGFPSPQHPDEHALCQTRAQTRAG